MTIAVQRDDLIGTYLDYVNRAIHEISLKHSFEQMKAIGSGSVTIGQTRVQLPADFKELQDGRYPVFDSVANALVPVFTRPEVEKLLGAGNALGLVPKICYIYTQDFTGGVASFNLDLPASDTVTHNVTMNYFAFPAIQTDPTQTTPLITFYFNLVLLKSLSIAFESINDPVYMVHEKQFQLEMQQYTGEDIETSEADVTGRRT
jgi:hypothetical protein